MAANMFQVSYAYDTDVWFNIPHISAGTDAAVAKICSQSQSLLRANNEMKLNWNWNGTERFQRTSVRLSCELAIIHVHGVSKNVPLCHCPLSSPNINQFSKFFHWHILWKICNNMLLNIPPHLNCVATLPCEIQISKNRYYRSKCIRKNYHLKQFSTTRLHFN